MADFICLMHNDAPAATDAALWPAYLKKLEDLGILRGGSAIGGGVCVRKEGAIPAISAQLGGYIRIEADDLDQVLRCLDGNPAYEAGGTVEIRELPKS